MFWRELLKFDFVQCDHYGDGKHVGAIARTVGADSQIENCYISGSLATTGNCAAGGLIGQVQSGTLEIQNCIVNAEIENKDNNNRESLAGGLVGSVKVKNGTQLNIMNCIAMGSVSTNSGRGAGGLVGGQGKQLQLIRAQHCKKRFPQTVRNTM